MRASPPPILTDIAVVHHMYDTLRRAFRNGSAEFEAPVCAKLGVTLPVCGSVLQSMAGRKFPGERFSFAGEMRDERIVKYTVRSHASQHARSCL